MNKHILLVMQYINDPKSVTREELRDNSKSADAVAYAAGAVAYAVKRYFEITKENRADYEIEILKTERERHIERLTRICRNSGYHCSRIAALEEVLRLKELELKELRKERVIRYEL